jgi:alpha/beta superfamily hydrolase
VEIIDDVHFPSRGDAPPVTLHGKLHRYADDRRRTSVLLCHPSSAGEAHYNHPIIRKLVAVLSEEGFNLLRFNMRGIAPSTGEISQGLHEPDDVRGALDFFGQVPTIDPDRLYLVGHSFGAAMGLKVASEDERVKAGIALGFPLRGLDMSIPGAPRRYRCDHEETREQIRSWNKHKVFITGEKDQSGPIGPMLGYFQSLVGTKTFIIVGESDHYFGQGTKRHLDHPWLVEAAEHVRRTLARWATPA